MEINTYLFFNGTCDEAIAFYSDALGAKEMFKMRFKDAPPNPEQPTPPELADKVMHASLQIGESIVMMSDGGCMSEQKTFSGFSVSLTGSDAADGQRLFDALAKGGNVMMPYQKTFWSPGFGMLTDRFGVHWMVTAPPQEQPS